MTIKKLKHPDSYYAATANSIFTTKAVNIGEELECDVCIIGGGYTGLSSALHLSKQGKKVIVVEANLIGWGASGRNGGQVCSGFNKDQDALEAVFGRDDARRLWNISEQAKALVEDLVSHYDIDCDYSKGIIHAACKESEVSDYATEVKHLTQHYQHKDIHFLNQNDITDLIGTTNYFGGSLDLSAGHLHPLNYALGLAKAASSLGAAIYQQSKVSSYEFNLTGAHRVTVCMENGVIIKSDKLIVATNGYLGKLDSQIAPYIMPLNNFILATEPLDDDVAESLIKHNYAVADSKFVVNYYRLSKDKRLLFGGGENYRSNFPSDIKNFVRPHMLNVFPQLKSTKIDYAWGGTLAITMNRLPDFGCKDNCIYYMHGYSGQGVALSTMAGKLVADKIQGDGEEYDLMATLTKRKFPGGTLFRKPGQIAGMLYYSLLDNLGS